MKQLLVTGGAGFIGSNFVHYILNKYPEYEVVVLDSLTYAGNKDNLKDAYFNNKYSFVLGDICDAKIVDHLVSKCDAVVHFAAESHVDRSITDPGVFVKTNVLGTQVLLDACVRHNKRFHHISTDEVFGSLPLEGAELFCESTPYDPSSPYSAAKAGADHLVRAYHRTFGLQATITNCSNNYGRFQFPEKLIPLMIINALSDKKLPVYGNGLNVRDWIHVEDHCSAIDLVLHEGRIGQTYLVGGNAQKKNLEVIKKILTLLDKGEDLLETVPDRKGHDLRYAIDSSKIESELGWSRKYDFESGLAQTVAWYVNHKDWWTKLLSRDK